MPKFVHFAAVAALLVAASRTEAAIAHNPLVDTFDLAAGTGNVYQPYDIAVNNRSNRVYITDEQRPEVTVVDASSHMVLKRMPLEPQIFRTGNDRITPFVAVSERLNRIYVARSASTSGSVGQSPRVDVFDGSDDTPRSVITIDSTKPVVCGVAIDDARRRLYVTVQQQGLIAFKDDSYDFLLIYDLDSEARLSTITLASGKAPGLSAPGGLAVNPVTGRVYVSIANQIYVVDGNAGSLIHPVTVGPSVSTLSIDRARNKIYVATKQSGSDPNTYRSGASVIDGTTDTVERSFFSDDKSQPNYRGSIAVDEVTNTVFVGSRDPVSSAAPTPAGFVTGFDGNHDYQSLGFALVGLKTAAMAFDYRIRQLFVAHYETGTVSVLQNDTPAPPDVFANISTRGVVGPGDNALIGGFIVAGPAGSTKKVMVRALGPSLTQAGVSGPLPDPTLEIRVGSGPVVTNDNWIIDDASHQSQQAEIEATGLAPTNEYESALVRTVPAGQNVTAIVRGNGTGSGVALVEVYDLDRNEPIKVANISTRGQTFTGENVMIAGVIISGSQASDVVLRALGPSLANPGVPGALQDPVLELRDPNGVVIASNDDWQEHKAEIEATMLAPSDPRESAIMATLYPANYTAIIRGESGEVGVGLIEAYFLGN